MDADDVHPIKSEQLIEYVLGDSSRPEEIAVHLETCSSCFTSSKELMKAMETLRFEDPRFVQQDLLPTIMRAVSSRSASEPSVEPKKMATPR
jgi:hypothetical protein